ncbi:Na+/H+ antiporter [Gemmata sp. JC717]|uniref:Na+/H+ antiporter n=1 Tax=Gemmata algarum TaxID=2975278 RepID=UPI0021BB52ED|nr:Na+/H+ antiporter [Gemmata algarum]MDY3551928.1 Na+/H+ antiporter [Gemmata algarum]
MNPVEIVVGLILVAVVLAAAAQRLRVPYPAALVLGGLALGFVPGLPHIQIPPAVAFLVFIPPLVYQVASRFGLRDLRHHRWPIFRLAVGLMLLNLICVAGAVRWADDGFSWAAAFVLAAVVGPTDTAAVAAVARGLPVPRRAERILEGESLFNDVVALVAYQQAVRAVATGTFSPGLTCLSLAWGAVGGIGVGLAAGALATWSRRRVSDPAVNTAASFLTPFAAYLGGEAVGASGVLATVAAGLFVGHVLLPTLPPTDRIQAVAFWDGTRFLLEGLAFVLIGFQLRAVLSEPVSASAWITCAVVCATTVAVRLVWTLAWNVPLFARRAAPDHVPRFRHAVLIGWAGMRGVDSLAAALALPLVTADGVTPFPQRDLIALVAFSTILVTLVLQGLTLPILIRTLGLPPDDAERREDAVARLAAVAAALRRLDELESAHGGSADALGHLRAMYQFCLRQYQTGLDAPTGADPGDGLSALTREPLKAEREAVRTLWADGRIGDETRRRAEQALDHEELTFGA